MMKCQTAHHSERGTVTHDLPITAAAFDALPADEAAALLRACCAAPGWVQRVTEGRPYLTRDAVLEASDAGFDQLDASDVADALADHPRIGGQVDDSSDSASFSRAEQASMDDADEQVRRDLLAGNADYEARFDRVFLIRAAGRQPQEILTELLRRMGNDEHAEVTEVAEQLRQITHLRLEAMLR